MRPPPRSFVLFLLLCALLPLLHSAAPTSDPGLQAAFQRAVHQVQPVAGGFEAFNPAQRLSARFTASEARLKYEDGSVGLRLRGYGYGERLLQPAAAQLVANGNRVEYRRGALTEWYVNSPAGIEQGFTLAARQERAAPGERLTIALEVTGGVDPALAPGGDAVLLGGLRYSGLKAWDAAGRELPSRLEVRGGQVRLVIADERAAYPVTVDPLVQQTKLTPLGAAAGDYLGWSVAVGGDTAVIGAPYKASSQGAVYVFTRTGSAWSQQAKLAASDGAANDRFGWSVSVSGDTAVIGAPYKAGSQGAVYVFTRSGSAWSEQAKLLASDPAASDQFGQSVAVSGDTLVIGAPNKAIIQGAAYVFTRSGSVWTQQQKLLASDGAMLDFFGSSVAVSGDTAVIGAHGKASTIGAAYAFTRTDGVWSQQAKLLASDGATSDHFGWSVALSGETALISASTKASSQGAAYVFTRTGSAWSEQAKLLASDGDASDHFGSSVALSGDMAVIGASSQASIQGAAYVFTRTGTAWSQQDKLVASDGAANDNFGYSVTLSGETVVIGAPAKADHQGAVYVFGRPHLTIASVPSGLQFLATGAGCPTGALTTPYTFPAETGCTISFASPILNGAGNTRYTFIQWQDGDASNPRSFPAPSQEGVFTAQFLTEYLLTATASPAFGGQVTGAGWYTESASATVAATAAGGYYFAGFSGDLSGTTTPQNLLMNAPKTVTASFLATPGAVMTALIAAKSGSQNARRWSITLRNTGPGAAYAPQIHGLMLTQTYGTACAPARLGPAFPMGLADLAVGASATGSAIFDFTGCPANARFTVLIVFTANSGSSAGATTLANQTM